MYPGCGGRFVSLSSLHASMPPISELVPCLHSTVHKSIARSRRNADAHHVQGARPCSVHVPGFLLALAEIIWSTVDI
jgi:hypothetical protein